MAAAAPGEPAAEETGQEWRALLVEELTQAVLRKTELEDCLGGLARGFQRDGKRQLGGLRRWQRDMCAAASQDISRQEEALRSLLAENSRLKGAVRSLVDGLQRLGVPPPCPEGWAAPWPAAGAPAPECPASAARGGGPPAPPAAPSEGAIAPPRGTGQVDGGHPVVITLRRADGVALGLRITSEWEGKGLRVEGIEPGGTAAAWNRLCDARRAIREGDVLVAVNGATLDALGMLQECQSSRLLKLVIARGQDGPLPTSGQQHAARALNPNAPEFAPAPAPPRRALGERQLNAQSGPGDARTKPPLPRLEENSVAEKENDIFEDYEESVAEYPVPKGGAEGSFYTGGAGGVCSAAGENREN